jgi:hypothetical protein
LQLELTPDHMLIIPTLPELVRKTMMLSPQIFYSDVTKP